jgi:hypothetical protein
LEHHHYTRGPPERKPNPVRTPVLLKPDTSLRTRPQDWEYYTTYGSKGLPYPVLAHSLFNN